MEAKRSQKKTKDILIVFATEMEARATIKILQALQKNELYHFEGGAILIAGVGSLQATVNLAAVLTPFEEVWNIGLAASPSKEEGLFPVGEVNKFFYTPPTTSEHSRNFCSLPSINLGPGKSLLTADFPIHDKTLGLKTDLIDMEGYGIALLCKRMQKKLKMWKIVSDFGEEGGELLIRAKINDLSKQMATFIYESL